MKALVTLAAFVQAVDPDAMPPERFDRLKRHIVDTWAAQVAGRRTAEGQAVARLGPSTGVGLTAEIVTGCAHARCTEIDDIHLTSCTTPGAVVVSTALALASSGAFTTAGEMCAAALAGYEAMIRLGVAIDGPMRLATIWPTGFTASFGSAATTCRACRLSVDRTAGALATSLAFAQRTAVPSAPADSSRWLTLGVAASNGVLAAHGAREGLTGAMDVGAWSASLTRGIGRRFLFDAIGMKPYPTARQGLAAIEAVRALVGDETIDPLAIDRIVVHVPERQRAIVDRAGFPETRFASIVNVRYQIALALLAPDRLIDVRRTPLLDDARIRRVMSRVRVARARDLDARYPASWPARVDVDASGRRRRRLVMHPRGDARNPLTWDDLRQKAQGIAGPVVGAAAVDKMVNAWRGATAATRVSAMPR